jgi:hypothetical protein
MAVGSIYILANGAMPGYVKVGRTTGSPSERAREISRATGVAFPFIVVYSVEVIDCELAERQLHDRLADYRANKGREFFFVETDIAVEALRSVAECVGRHVRIPESSTTVATDETADRREGEGVADGTELPSLARPNPTRAKCQTNSGYSSVADFVAADMAPHLADDKQNHLAALREVVLRVCPDCLWQMRQDGKIIFTPPQYKHLTRDKNLMTLHFDRKSIQFRIVDMVNKQGGREPEWFDVGRLVEIESRLAAWLVARSRR